MTTTIYNTRLDIYYIYYTFVFKKNTKYLYV